MDFPKLSNNEWICDLAFVTNLNNTFGHTEHKFARGGKFNNNNDWPFSGVHGQVMIVDTPDPAQ